MNIVKFLIVLCGFLINQTAHSQNYIEKQTRHRFAQLTLGTDIQSSFGGSTKYLSTQGISSINLGNIISPRVLIGGTHFWGHADFYIAIPANANSLSKENQDIFSLRGVETIFKFYPLCIENNKVRPYIGTSIVSHTFKQNNNDFEYPKGPELNSLNYPLHGGVTFNYKNHLLELGVAWNYSNKRNYFISPNLAEAIELPSIYTAVSYRYMLDTTISAEKDWESGYTKEATQLLSDRGRLNGFYLGAGLSSAFWLKESTYNAQRRAYIGKQDNSLILDLTLGYYLHSPDMNFALGYRTYSAAAKAYGTAQRLNRKSILFESTKYLFDYHGFVPFVGPAASYEVLSFKETFKGSTTADKQKNTMALGLTFGWDIRPNRIQSWILRTNLRWYPKLSLETGSSTEISFENIEFNFIQLIIYPNRMMKK